MIQQSNSLFSFTPILHSTALNEQEQPIYSTYTYDFYHKQFTTTKKVVNFEQFIYIPLYAGVCNISNTNDYIVTGGVIYQEDNLKNSYSTNYCMQISLQENNVILYDHSPETQQSVIPQLICARHNHKVFELQENGKRVFIVVGGQYFDENQQKFILNTCEKLIEGSDKWIEIAPLTKSRAGFSGFVINNKIYIFGGIENIQDHQPSVLPVVPIEIYHIETNQWELIKKYKVPLGISISLDSLCLPINNEKILIIGGSRHTSSDQIAIMDINKSSIEKLSSKLSISRAKAYGKIIKQVITKQILRTENEEIVEEVIKDLLIVFGGSQNKLTMDIFEINNEQDLQLIQIQDFSKILDQSYEINDLKRENAWLTALMCLPVLIN